MTTVGSPEWIAHRGACFAAPENSLEAFDRAVREGAARIEFDVHLSTDGVVFVSHDDSTGRVTGQDLSISRSHSDTLSQLRLSNGEPLPTLDATCDLLCGRAELDVEIKVPSARLVRRVCAGLRAHGLLSDALLTSFDWQTLAMLRSVAGVGRRGLLIGSRSLNPITRAYEAWPLPTLLRCHATDLVIHRKLAHTALRSACRRRGIGVSLWFDIPDEQVEGTERGHRYRRAVALGPDAIIVGRIAEAIRSIHG